MGARDPMGWVGVGYLWVLGVCMGWVGIGLHLWVPGTHLGLGGHWEPLGAGVPLGWRVLGCTFGCQDPLGLGGLWVPLGAGVPFQLEGAGLHPWVLGTS